MDRNVGMVIVKSQLISLNHLLAFISNSGCLKYARLLSRLSQSGDYDNHYVLKSQSEQQPGRSSGSPLAEHI